jgi:hypothetical protein
MQPDYQKRLLVHTLRALLVPVFLTPIIAAHAGEVSPNENLVAEGTTILATLAENPLRLGLWLAQPEVPPALIIST